MFLENFQPTCFFEISPIFPPKYTPLLGGSYQIPKLYMHILCLNSLYDYQSYKLQTIQYPKPTGPLHYQKKGRPTWRIIPFSKWFWLVNALRIRVVGPLTSWLKQKTGSDPSPAILSSKKSQLCQVASPGWYPYRDVDIAVLPCLRCTERQIFSKRSGYTRPQGGPQDSSYKMRGVVSPIKWLKIHLAKWQLFSCYL